MLRKRTTALTFAAVSVLLVAPFVAGPVAAALPETAVRAFVPSTVESTSPGFTVENYVHPEAARLGTEHSITLKDGNGKMLLVECSNATNLIQVESLDANGSRACFKVTASPAWLKVEITSTFGVRAGDKELTVISILPGGTPTEPITDSKSILPNNHQAIGGGTGQAVLVELKVG